VDVALELKRQRRLVEASYALHTTLDLDELLGKIVAVAAEGVGADRGTVFFVTADGKELWSRVLSSGEDLEIRLPLGQGVAGSVAATGEVINIADAYADPRFDRSWDEKSGFLTEQILTAPIRNRAGDVVGVFQLLNKPGGFDADDESYLDALSVHAALAIENARLHASALEKQRYDREVELALDVQRTLQPERREVCIGEISAAGLNELCEDASGDYYDLIDLPGDRIGVVVGDVSGHGLQAALLMAETRAFLRAYFLTAVTLKQALDLLNDSLVPDLSGGRFVSLFAATVHTRTGAVEWCNAGHNPPWVCRASGELTPLLGTGRVLGILPGADYGRGAPLVLEPGDLLLAYSDGITESRSPARELFGADRLGAALQAAVGQEPAAILDSLGEAVTEWTGGARRDDDVTLLAVKRVPNRDGSA